MLDCRLVAGSGSALQITRAAQDQDQDQDYANRRGAKRGNRRISMKKCAGSQRARNQAARESRELHWFQLLRPWRQWRAQLGISQAAPPSTVLYTT